MNRSPLPRRTRLRRRSPLRSRPSRTIPARSAATVRQRSGGLCEVRAEGCTGQAQHFHHRRLRSQGGSHEPDLIAHCCAHCHLVAIHGNPAWAYAHGWLIRTGEDHP